MRLIKVKGDTGSKIQAIALLNGLPALPEAEVKTLQGLIKYATNGSLFVSIELSKQIRAEFGLSTSSLATALHRLEKKGVIKKSGKTTFINAHFLNLDSLDKLLVQFIKEPSPIS